MLPARAEWVLGAGPVTLTPRSIRPVTSPHAGLTMI